MSLFILFFEVIIISFPSSLYEALESKATILVMRKVVHFIRNDYYPPTTAFHCRLLFSEERFSRCDNLLTCFLFLFSPHDVLATLLNNLKVQERQNRVCTTVAIAIVAETCSPFTVLPALMNEYRVPELNVQNGVLKSLSFLFEYIGEMGKDYIYAVTPLLEDALMDR